MANQFTLEIIYATSHQQSILQIAVSDELTVAEVVALAKVFERWPELANSPLKLASFGRSLKLNDTLTPYDRIEILATIQCDPKAARIRRAGSDAD